jgi:hypothetical protein
MFRSAGDELEALRAGGSPYFTGAWRDDEVGLVLPAEPDWDEIGELLTESYLLLAPGRLAALVERDLPGAAG